MAKRGQAVKFRLAKVCAILNKTECELAHTLGLSRAALKAIDRRGAPLYLQLALTALMAGTQPAPFLQRYNDNDHQGCERELMKQAG
ncbi:hypothetical protein WKW50_20640 [Ochrobactrum sp. GPK 3]|uniref:hypothetical protein n=1 Tax=Brucella/Ochrobactrum group TaxID=2826938 RepID=UPI00099231C6|nr:hypothetical protein [Ochrobactrum sp. P6BSIII]OOL13590.1 hypothetical protein BRY73_24670 [Ochrobactrum sp. P6BS-III]